MTLRRAALAILLVASVAGCTSATPPVSSPTPSAPADIVFQEVVDQIGWYPADTPWGEGERAQALMDAADSYWSRASQQYPDAQRPSVAAVQEVSDGDLEGVLGTCLDEAGVNLYSARPFEFVPTSLQDNLTWYTCLVEYPSVPRPSINDEQLGYLYDFLTLFVVPCLEARGSRIDTAPPRDTFIAEWPNQNWYPSSNAALDSQYETGGTACSSDVRDYAAE